jgi:hypothetical protein
VILEAMVNGINVVGLLGHCLFLKMKKGYTANFNDEKKIFRKNE